MSDIMTIRVPSHMQDDLKQIASEWGVTRNALVLQILRDWLKNNAASNG